MHSIKKLTVFATALFALLGAMSVQAQQATVNIQFNWVEPACDSRCVGIDGYRISAVGGGVIADTSTVGHVVSNYALSVGEESCFTIHAYNSAGNSEESDPACLVVDQTVPGKVNTFDVTFPVGN